MDSREEASRALTSMCSPPAFFLPRTVLSGGSEPDLLGALAGGSLSIRVPPLPCLSMPWRKLRCRGPLCLGDLIGHRQRCLARTLPPPNRTPLSWPRRLRPGIGNSSTFCFHMARRRAATTKSACAVGISAAQVEATRFRGLQALFSGHCGHTETPARPLSQSCLAIRSRQ